MLALLLAPGALAGVPELPVQVELGAPLEMVGTCMEQAQATDVGGVVLAQGQSEGALDLPCSSFTLPCTPVFVTIYTDPYRAEPHVKPDCVNDLVGTVLGLLP